MFTEQKMNVLCVIAHPDDLELMAGGTIAKWINEGDNVHVLDFTDGVWTAPDGVKMRHSKEALLEEKAAADYLGYTIENLKYPAQDLKFEDKLVCEVISRINKMKIDTILCTWENDIDHDHEIVARIAMSASKRVPRIIMGQINYYLRNFFTPNIFVDITSTWDQKIRAMECFKSQWDRIGEEWYEFLDETSRYYGKMCGVKRAEGFVSKKFMI